MHCLVNLLPSRRGKNERGKGTVEQTVGTCFIKRERINNRTTKGNRDQLKKKEKKRGTRAIIIYVLTDHSHTNRLN